MSSISDCLNAQNPITINDHYPQRSLVKNSHQLMSSILVLLPLLSNTQISNAQTVETETSEDSIHVVEMSEVLITGGKEDIQSLPGSAHIMDQQELEKFNYSDIHQVLSSTPGVYLSLIHI